MSYFTRIWFIAASFAAILLTAHCAHAKLPGGTGTTYYFSTSGSDSNSGTSPSSPWQTATKFAAATFVAGDTILFKCNEVFLGQWNAIDTSSGGHMTSTASSPITIGSYGGCRATIQTSDATGASPGLSVDTLDGLIIKDLIFVGSGVDNGAAFVGGIYINTNVNTKTGMFLINNVEARGWTYGFMSTSGGAGNLWNVSILNSSFHDNTRDGVHFDGTQAPTYRSTNVFIHNVQTYNNPGVAAGGGFGVDLYSVNTAVVQRSVAYNNGTAGPAPVGIVASNTRNVTIQSNEVYLTKSGTTLDGDGIDCDIAIISCLVQFNYAHDNVGVGHLFFSTTAAGDQPSLDRVARYNVLQNNCTGAWTLCGDILLGCEVGDARASFVYNNAIFNSKNSNVSAGILIDGTTCGADSAVANNIIYTTGQVRSITSTNNSVVPVTGNDYFTTGTMSFSWNGTAYSTIALWRAAISNAENYRTANTSIIVDPTLTSPGTGGTVYPAALSTLTAYKLLAGSPMINTGQNLPVVFGLQPGIRDFYGNTVPQGAAPDVGAHELQ